MVFGTTDRRNSIRGEPGSGATTELLERESELGGLAERIGAAKDGRGATVAIEGEAGIGKTALLAAAVERARMERMEVLGARGGELERDLPYGVVQQLFEPALARATASRRERLLAGAAGLALPAISPVDTETDPRDAPGAVLHGLYWLAANLAAERPLLLVLDDAHWIDAASLRFVSYLARRVEELPLVIVYAARPGEGAGNDLPALADPELVAAVVRPMALSEAAAGELVARLLGAEGSAAFVRACRVATGGNPFLLRELLSALGADGGRPHAMDPERVAGLAPESISRATLARLRRLGEPATRLAFAVALLGASGEFRHAAELAELEPEAATQAADALASAAILRPGTPLEFAHPIVRAAVYAEIPSARRASTHRRAARLLERDGAAPDALAPHLLAAEPIRDAGVAALLREAARTATVRGAPETACAYLERALAEPPPSPERAAVLRELGSAELRAGRPRSVEHLHAALELTRDVPTRAAITGEIALAMTAARRVPEANELLDPVIAEIARIDPEAAMRLDAELIGAAQLDLTVARSARRRLASYEGRIDGASLGERLLLAECALDVSFRAESMERAVALAEMALGDGRLLREQRPDSYAFYHTVLVLTFADRLELAERMLDLALEDARARASLPGFAAAAGCRSHVLLRQGRIAEAEADAYSGLEAARQGLPGGLEITVGYLLDAMVERADVEDCEALLTDTGLAAELPPSTMGALVLHPRGHLRLAAGDPGRALDDFEELLDRDERWGMKNPAAWPTHASAALAHAQLGERERARELARTDLERARRWGAPSGIAAALRAAGVAEGGEAGIELLRESAAVVERSPARYEHARSLTELGAALRRAGHRREARDPLRDALDLAYRCGARRLARRAREELVAAGARPRRMSLTGLDSLTASERRVAQMAAAGLANREIAQALFVTRRTVEMHLTHGYQKLGIRSREQLPEVLGAEEAPSAAGGGTPPRSPTGSGSSP